MDFINLSILDIFDAFLVAVLLYYVYKLIKGTVAVKIFIGIAIVFIMWKLTQLLKMEMLSGILGTLIGGGAIALIVVFQQEIRKFLLMIGSSNFASRRSFVRQLKFLNTENQDVTDVASIIRACEHLSKLNTGALIVLEKTNNLDFVRNTGDQMFAKVNIPILESIFFKNSPLHDGAVIIKNNFIIAARVVLPLSSASLPSQYGLRVRAAVGITERTDALCVLVSEETGKISYIKDGIIIIDRTSNEITEMILKDLG
ncbi:MAG TPA: diadenylate cyclase CdaA [Flavobacteriaceae bacterium]|nr:diadenylate cyclase CdaA [Flavobacteriaceae bacterium]HEX5743250.1 diadenylate cyclase CdaA [Flavobacteriaceae bacterium]